MILEIINTTWEFLAHKLAWLIDPTWLIIAQWYILFALLVLILAAVEYFLGFLTFVRWIVGTIIVLAGAFLAGGHVMYREMKGRLDDQKAKAKREEPVSRGGWWDGGSR